MTESDNPSDNPRPSRYTSVVDLTTRAQEAAKRERAKEAFPPPDPALPEVEVNGLPPRARAAAEACGWPTLTEVQRQGIPYFLAGVELIVQARTGSGKTGAFLLPLFELIDTDSSDTQVLILCPTRELARQIHAECVRMRPDAIGLRTALVYGGVRYGPQMEAFKAGAHIVVGTPGRVLDHLERRSFSLDKLRYFILDEADEMLSMGFLPAMEKMARFLPEDRKSYMFSATMPTRVQNLARRFLREPGFLGLSAGKEAVETMEHRYFICGPMDKDRALVRLIEMEHPDSAIVFANTKRDVEYVAQFLKNYGHDADGLSGDLSQKQREYVMERIRSGTLRFLVATDVAARGIDISDLSHVFLYDVPQDPEYYIHRSGRTARAGRSGTVLVLATLEDERSLQAMATRYGVTLQKTELPTDDEVTDRVSERLTVLLEQMHRDRSNLERERLHRFTKLATDLAKEEPELLAMLLDSFYHESLHAGPESDSEMPSDEGRSEPSKRRDEGRGRGRGRPRGGGGRR